MKNLLILMLLTIIYLTTCVDAVDAVTKFIQDIEIVNSQQMMR